MANVGLAIQYVLRQEDSTLSGVITESPEGFRTRFGIDERYHPELANCLFYASMGTAAALRIAESIYEAAYAEPLCIADIQSQRVANKLLSLGVNCGVGTAAKMLQDALGVEGDGRIGPLTLDRLDKAGVEGLLDKLRRLAEAHYGALIRANPELAVYRDGWMRRAEA